MKVLEELKGYLQYAHNWCKLTRYSYYEFIIILITTELFVSIIENFK